MHQRFLALALAMATLLTLGCANPITPQQPTTTETANLCVADIKTAQQQLLAQQQTLIDHLNHVRQQLSASAEPGTVPVQCPERAYAAEPSQPGAAQPLDRAAKQLVGGVEQVSFDGLDMTLAARLDTGKALAVFDARDIQMFERNSENWVRFNVPTHSGEPRTLERQVTRMASVSQARSEAKKRPVITMRFTLGRVSQQGEFVLADRSGQAHSVLLGRLVLRDVMIVDVSRDNIASAPAQDNPQ
jgi:hypothetical protein